jgi:uncharacterized membrane protein (UPF0127 family)
MFSQIKGLMFSPPLKQQEGIILVSNKEDLGSIHMFFVFFPIDVLWLDKRAKVIHKAERVLPFTYCVVPPKKAQYIVELPAKSTVHIQKDNQVHIKKN